MNSSHLQSNRWAHISYSAGVLNAIKGTIPNKHGVYIFCAPAAFGRVNGESNIIYIGCAGGHDSRAGQGIRGRILNTRGNSEKWIRNKIENMLQEFDFTVYWLVTTEGEGPKCIEQDLLCQYREEHFELPPANSTLGNGCKH